MENKKLGIMGGTFDPIHFAHLILAQQCKEEFSLDHILFIPTGIPPHKEKQGVSSARQRLAMTELAVADNPFFSCSNLEIVREGNTYTVQTLKALKAEKPDADLYFIMGADSFFQLDTWFEFQDIFGFSKILLANRGEKDLQIIKQKIQDYQMLYAAEIYLVHTPNLEISSRALRSKIQQGYSIQYYVPETVLQYIQKEKLYKMQV
ncbi:nicotinate-nicotinamide nucleotide adenylyltransferase [Clostridia bacterium]|nr:nicotinate-nicotinamide nucleotide adenylyltransferase [Clostridia bacterium]